MKTPTNDDIAKALLNMPPGRRVEAPPSNKPPTLSQIMETKDSKLRPMIERIEALKVSEAAGDLAWMTYGSWLYSGPRFQQMVRDQLHPFFWGSCYFEKSKFIAALPQMVRSLPSEAKGSVIKIDGGLHVVIINSDNDYHKTHDLELKRLIIGKSRAIITFSPSKVTKCLK